MLLESLLSAEVGGASKMTMFPLITFLQECTWDFVAWASSSTRTKLVPYRKGCDASVLKNQYL